MTSLNSNTLGDDPRTIAANAEINALSNVKENKQLMDKIILILDFFMN